MINNNFSNNCINSARYKQFGSMYNVISRNPNRFILSHFSASITTCLVVVAALGEALCPVIVGNVSIH